MKKLLMSLAVIASGASPICAQECVPAPSGIVAWWPGEDTANDVIGTNVGILSNVIFTNGVVNRAFYLNGSNAFVQIPYSTSLQPTNVTVEAWVKLETLASPVAAYPGLQYIVFKKNSRSGNYEGYDLEKNRINGQDVFRFQVTSSGGRQVPATSTTVPQAGVWYYLAGTYDGATVKLYVNGVLEGTAVAGFPLDYGTHPVYIGTSGEYWDGRVQGAVDEISIYNRALASNEIAAIYGASSAGKCPPQAKPPLITSQPTNQTVPLGCAAAFMVTASGTPPMRYQWNFNGTNIDGATNDILTITGVQLTNAGSYSVLVANSAGSTNSATATLAVVFPPSITQQPQNQTVISYSNASFTVVASGTAPLSYHWRKNGTNLVDGGYISGSTAATLSLTSVSLSDAGNYDVVVSNPYATTNSAVALLIVPQTVVTLGATNCMSGNTVVVPVLMNAVGEVNAFQASVVYDPTKLALENVTGTYLAGVNMQTNNGLVGFAIVLNPGFILPAGTNEVVDLTFHALPVTNNATVTLAFGDNPNSRTLVDNSLRSWPAIYQSGSVVVVPAEYAADVYPRTNGDSQVNLFDWLEIGRMVAGIDTLTNNDELLRADCAPRNAPDGVLTVADWVQAGRYAMGLDQLTLVTQPATPNYVALAKPMGKTEPSRILRIGNVSAQRGQVVSVPVQLVCITNENAVGMTVGFNTNQLNLVSVALGSAITGGRLYINTNRFAGEVGVVLALSPGTTLASGTNQVALLQFSTAANASGIAALTLNNNVVTLQVANKMANALDVTLENGAVVLPMQPELTVTENGTNLQMSWPLATGTFQVQTADTLAGPWTTIVLPLVTNGASVSVLMSKTNQQQYFRLQGQ